MARIVLGMGTSHAPQLQIPPAEWFVRKTADMRNPNHWYQGRGYGFDELVEKRSAEHFERELTPEKAEARWNACQRSIAHLGETLDRVSPDVCVIVGDDQHEAFLDDNLPAMCVYWGETVDDAPTEVTERAREIGLIDYPAGNAPPQRLSHPTDPILGRHIIESLIEDG